MRWHRHPIASFTSDLSFVKLVYDSRENYAIETSAKIGACVVKDYEINHSWKSTKEKISSRFKQNDAIVTQSFTTK